MGLGLGYALAGLGQGLEQGVGQYLAQKRYETEQAQQAQQQADMARLRDAEIQHYQSMDQANDGRVSAALLGHGYIPASDGTAPEFTIGDTGYAYDPTRDPTQIRAQTVGQEIAARKYAHDTPTGTAIYNVQHRAPRASASSATRPIANAPGSVGALTHSVAADKAAVLDLKQTLDAARKNPPSGRALLRQNPQADTTAILNGFRADTTDTRRQLDAARGRLQQHTAQLGAVAGGQHMPTNGTVTPSDGTRYLVQPDMDKAQAYESLRDQGYSHEDAIALLEGAQ